MTFTPRTSALDELRSRGFTGEFALDVDAIPPGIRCRTCGRGQLAERALVIEVVPAPDPATTRTAPVALGLQCPRCSTKGVVVTDDTGLSAAEHELVVTLCNRAANGDRPAPPTEPSRDLPGSG